MIRSAAVDFRRWAVWLHALPSDYPAINTPLPSGPNTYYFRTYFQWTNDTANVAFVVTNYLSDGAVYYLNGAQLDAIRMPAGTVTYATAGGGHKFSGGKPRRLRH